MPRPIVLSYRRTSDLQNEHNARYKPEESIRIDSSLLEILDAILAVAPV